jgi:hypothetical protein
MKQTILILAATLTLITQQALAHGEDKPGPHGGFIRMPGAFHTEVAPTASNKLKVFLLDIQWKNPSVDKSSLVVTYKAKTTAQAKCAINEDHYVCEFPKNIDLKKKGTLLVEAQRENQKGNTVSYDLPLKLEVIDDGHGEHQ